MLDYRVSFLLVLAALLLLDREILPAVDYRLLGTFAAFFILVGNLGSIGAVRSFLAELMQGGKLWGAALDVTEPEPLPADSPLWEVPRLLITPHVAGGMRLEVTRKNCVQLALDNLRRYQNGEPLQNLVAR